MGGPRWQAIEDPVPPKGDSLLSQGTAKDMESASVVWAFAQYGVPAACLKIVSIDATEAARKVWDVRVAHRLPHHFGPGPAHQVLTD